MSVTMPVTRGLIASGSDQTADALIEETRRAREYNKLLHRRCPRDAFFIFFIFAAIFYIYIRVTSPGRPRQPLVRTSSLPLEIIGADVDQLTASSQPEHLDCDAGHESVRGRRAAPRLVIPRAYPATAVATHTISAERYP
jgi:hypothetical protein